MTVTQRGLRSKTTLGEQFGLVARNTATRTQHSALPEKDVLEKIKTFFRVNLKPWDFTFNPHGDVAAS
jgi:hypothetical protein